MVWFLLQVLALTVIYVMVGYPLLLAWMARRWPRPVSKSLQYRPAISVLLAVHNGAEFLEAKLDSLIASDYPRELLEIIVASDGSTDATEAIAARYQPHGVRLLRLPKGGKPAALNAAVLIASHEMFLFTDVRQTLEPHAIARLVACFSDPQVGVVSGYLVIKNGSAEEDNVGLYWRYERWIRSNLSALDSMLGATGAFYAMRRELFRPMPADLLLDDVFLPLHAFFQGYRLIIEPLAVIYDLPTDVDAEFRRKVRTLAGNYQIFSYFPQLFGPQNRMLGHFLSYKFGRLLLPWLLLGILAASFCLPSPWRILAVVPQLAGYGLAAVDFLVSQGSPLKRLSSPARAVIGMLLATACAASILVVPADRFWKPVRRPGVQ